ncbi:S-adenosyl-L-methionine-dependent methyltransferase [Phytophthora cactorum]|nr:S-adenosyl-L-methionine-dependent methyltransferase [Phytophthora cactorum]
MIVSKCRFRSQRNDGDIHFQPGVCVRVDPDGHQTDDTRSVRQRHPIQAESRKKSRQKKRKLLVQLQFQSLQGHHYCPSIFSFQWQLGEELATTRRLLGDAYWYDLQLEKRLLLAKPMLTELVLALPPCGDKTVLELCAGSGRASAAILEAYPTVKLVLVDSSEQRLTMASQRLEAVQQGVKERTQLVTKLCDEPVDVVVACLAFHVLTEKPAHYAQAEEEKTVSCGEHYVPEDTSCLQDHVGQLSLFKQLKTLEKAGFEDVDCAWRQDDSFVAGGRKPLLNQAKTVLQTL